MAIDQTKVAPLLSHADLQAIADRFQVWGENVSFANAVAKAVAAPLIAERDALTAKLAEAVDALRPFAADAAEWSAVDESFRPEFYQAATSADPAKFTVGDLRRAAAIVEWHES